MMTMASLFDGISGFPLAGSRHGIKALWSSEIEKFPVAVSALRFPDMVQEGDITKINGWEVTPVDIITFGSPCQDLSVAGKRAGLQHTDNGDELTTRSGLFMEAVRIIKEMQNATFGIFPRFAVWENVPGAYSSNKGEDFRIVLEELCKVADPTVSIPQSAKWQPAGCIMGNGYSLAWRTLDTQYWGVPQRHRRIYLVADFGGQSAPEVLFKREGLSGDIAESGEKRETSPTNAMGSPSISSKRTIAPAVMSVDTSHADDVVRIDRYTVPALQSRGYKGGNNVIVPINDQATHENGHCNGSMVGKPGDPMYSLTAQDRHAVATYQDKTGPLMANTHPGSYCGQDAYTDMFVANSMRVRRLTPLECERLMGYADGWTDIPGASDSGRYKALGNSLAIPCAEYVMEGLKWF